jgi:hypothetical protein
MARDDWRIRIELPEEEHALGLLSRLGLDLGSEARELARELEERRLAVSREGEHVFVYAASRLEAEQAQAVVRAELREQELRPTTVRLEHWLAQEDRWDDEPREPFPEDELLSRGYAPWEVRVECSTLEEARELTEELEAEGYGVVRNFHFVIAGTASRADAVELARRIQGEVEPGGELVWEVAPGNPFAVFGGMGGTGTPL